MSSDIVKFCAINFPSTKTLKKHHYQVTNDKDINGREKVFVLFFSYTHGLSRLCYALFNILKFFSEGGRNYFMEKKRFSSYSSFKEKFIGRRMTG